MIARLGPHRRVDHESEADTIVINSCTVTNAAESSARAYVARLKRHYPQVEILFTGCAVASEGEALLQKGQINGLFAHAQKEQIAHFLDHPPTTAQHDPTHLDHTLIEHFEGKQRAFIKIQEGCDFSCSYCIIPSVRGVSRSMDTGLICDQIRLLVAQGFGEFILTGTNSGSFGIDRGERLSDLVGRILQIKGVRRLRLGSLEPSQVDESLIALLDHPVMARHLHVALQHTCDRVLERMNRKNRFEGDRRLLERLSSLGYAIGTDYIVGFPGESEGEFEEALANLEHLPLTHIHLFSYSPRQGTPAAALKQDVDGETVTKRREAILARIGQKHRDFYTALGQNPLEVFVERSVDNQASGLDQYFSRVRIPAGFEVGSWVRVSRYRPLAGGEVEAVEYAL